MISRFLRTEYDHRSDIGNHLLSTRLVWAFCEPYQGWTGGTHRGLNLQGRAKQNSMWFKNRHFCQKCPSLRPKKWHFEWPNQNSKTSFTVQTFPNFGLYDFYFMNLSLLGAILAKFRFGDFRAYFGHFSATYVRLVQGVGSMWVTQL